MKIWERNLEIQFRKSNIQLLVFQTEKTEEKCEGTQQQQKYTEEKFPSVKKDMSLQTESAHQMRG